MSKVGVRKKGDGKLLVAPAEFLDGGRFREYLSVCKRSGARFSKADEGQLIDEDRFELLATHLARSGFTLECDDHSLELLNAILAKMEEGKHEIRRTFEAMEAWLAQRGLKLFPFQRDGVQWLMSKDRGLLADEMGLGKTPQALCALPPEAPVIVIAPAAVKGSWRKESKTWRPDYSVNVLAGRNSFRWPRNGEIVILNWDILPPHEDKKLGRYKVPHMPRHLAAKCPEGVVVIGDEAHAVKNRTALRTRRFAAISKTVRARDGRVWLLTGTPLLNRPPELWQVLGAADLARDAFGSWPNFVNLFNGTPGRFGGFDWGGPEDIDRSVPDLLRRVSLQRRRKVVLPELPEKMWRTIPVNGMDADLRAKCDALITLLLGEGLDIMEANDKVDLTRVEKVLFRQISEVRSALATHKIPSMLELIEEYEEQDQPVIVFSAHRPPVDILAKRDGWATITGSVSNERRTEIVEAFQAGRLKGIGATIQAAGVGLTLTHAHHAVFVDLAWTPALNQQAEDRICRIGQTRGCIITRLVADHSLDERVTELLHHKQQLISATVEASARKTVTDADLERPAPLAVPREQADGCDRDADEEDAAPIPKTNGAYNRRREPETDLERWAGDGILRVAALDPDHAATKNLEGFSKFDARFGHSLADQFQRGGKLTDKQWTAAIRLARKYRRQIPPEPTAQQRLDQTEGDCHDDDDH